MAFLLDKSIARVRTSRGEVVVGAAFLVTTNQLLTCWHVARQALEDDCLRLDFPTLASGQMLRARLEKQDEAADLALLRLEDPAPAGSLPVRLVVEQDASSFWGHRCRAFGFPAGYDSGVWAEGRLQAPIGDSGWLQLSDTRQSGYFVQPGFSGAPLWDEELDGVVGMITAADPSARAAFCIPAAQLLRFYPDLPTDSPLQRAYLEWLEQTHARLELRGIRVEGQFPTLPLEHVFVALKGIRTDPSDAAHSRALLEDEMRALEQDPRWQTLPEPQRREWRRYWLANHPYMPSLLERDRPSVLPERKVETLNLAEAFRRYRWLVILGDPGSGKTTLLRWLTLHLARALRNGEARLRVPATHVDPTARDTDPPIDLGPARLPVLVSVADFATARAERPDLSLIEYLGDHRWLGEKPTYGRGHPCAGEPLPPKELNALIRNMLHQGRAVILLDGLDELTERKDRKQIVEAIEAFIRNFIQTPSGLNPLDKIQPWRWQPEEESPGEHGGNQIIITSRIAGYYLYPLQGRLPLVTIEPMSAPAIDRFCQTWTLAVNRLTADPADSPAEIERRARQEAESLQHAIHDPNRPGIAEMASNPLLLTILAMLHHNTRARLPEQRVRLYQLAVENLVEVWRETGLTEDAVVNILAPVAAHIHDTSPTGLIPEPELKALLREPLARDPQNLPPSFDVEEFIRTVREQVGLLAARGDYLYGFLHLTFQEYLAARDLTRDPARTLERIREKLDDPRWREPILLALSYAASKLGIEERERLLEDLLAAGDPLTDLLPRNALLLAAALSEFERMPARIVTQVTQRLLTALADRQGIGRFEHLREQIIRALVRLRRGDAVQAFDQALEQALRDAPQARDEAALAAAWLIWRHQWYTPALADALLDALPFENQHWDWSVTRALQGVAQTHPEWLPASRLPFRHALESTAIRNFIERHDDIKRALLFLCGGLDAEGRVNPLAVYRQPALADWLEQALKRRLPPQQWVDELREIWLDAARTPEESAESLLALLGLGEEVWPLLQDPRARPAAMARARELLARLLATQGDAAKIHVVEAVLPEAVKVAAGFPDLVDQALAAARQIQNEYDCADALRALIPELGKHIQLWKAFWLELRLDLLRSRPYRIAEAVVQRLSSPLPWELIADPARRAAALEQILRAAYPAGELSLTAEAVQAIQTLLETGEETHAIALLRLARPQKDVPIPEAWLRHPSAEIRHLAYLLRAEAGALDTQGYKILYPYCAARMTVAAIALAVFCCKRAAPPNSLPRSSRRWRDSCWRRKTSRRLARCWTGRLRIWNTTRANGWRIGWSGWKGIQGRVALSLPSAI